jgi:phospholipid/cholesterol/gamma-HCH transport system substrate-binding protein
MASRNAAEIVTGAAVLLLAAGFLAYAVAHTGRSAGGGYTISAKFDDIAGLTVGSDVRIGGVKIGTVATTALDPKTYQAVVTLDVGRAVQIPDDSSAVVTSDGLLGGKYIAIQPGGDDKDLGQGGVITVTQGSVSLESLLGKFIFSASGNKASAASAPTGSAPAAPGASAPATLPAHAPSP